MPVPLILGTDLSPVGYRQIVMFRRRRPYSADARHTDGKENADNGGDRLHWIG
jgi:hypothetical protein